MRGHQADLLRLADGAPQVAGVRRREQAVVTQVQQDLSNVTECRTGLSETEARQQGVAVRVAKLPMGVVLRTWTTGENRGFMKVLVDARSDRILGFAMFGPEAGEVMSAVQTAMLAGMPYTGFQTAILAHPTMAEGLNGLFSGVPRSSAS